MVRCCAAARLQAHRVIDVERARGTGRAETNTAITVNRHSHLIAGTKADTSALEIP